MKDYNAIITKNEKIAENVYAVTFHLGETAKVRCGQFGNISVGGTHLLRRPIAICKAEGEEVTFCYQIKGEGIDLTTTAFLINFANASQWGYDAYIAPKASLQDGWLDVVIASEFPLVAAAGLALRLFTKTIDETLHFHTIRTKELTLTRQSEGVAHIDGTPVTLPAELHVKIVEDGLKVLVKKRF